MIRLAAVLLFLTVIFWLLFWGLPKRAKTQALHQAGRILTAFAVGVLLIGLALAFPHYFLN